MDLSIFLARFFGLYMLIIAAIWLTRKDQLESRAQEILSSNGVFALTGILQVLLGLAIAVSHSVWELDWRGLVTFLGYFMLFQGVCRLAFFDETRKYILQSFQKNRLFWLPALLIAGVFLSYHGFKNFL